MLRAVSRKKAPMDSLVAFMQSLPKRCALFVIKFYRAAISPIFGPCCRYVPSCSEYGLEAIRRFGLRKGGLLAIKRIARCHPFHEGGYDPVPDKL